MKKVLLVLSMMMLISGGLFAEPSLIVQKDLIKGFKDAQLTFIEGSVISGIGTALVIGCTLDPKAGPNAQVAILGSGLALVGSVFSFVALGELFDLSVKQAEMKVPETDKVSN